MKRQDVLILLKIFLWEGRSWTQHELARALSISASEVNHGLKRLSLAKLYDPIAKIVMKGALLELLVYALKYIFPAKVGSIKRGMLTAHAAPSLAKEFSFNSNDSYVWPDKQGEHRGLVIEPLYPSAPEASRNDPQLYDLLTLIDAIRAGRVREAEIAKQKLTAKILRDQHTSS